MLSSVCGGKYLNQSLFFPLSVRAVLQPSSASHCLWRAVPHPISVFLCPGSTVANQCFPRSTLANQCFPLSVMAIPQPISVFLCLQWQYHSQSVVFSFCPLHHFISNHLMISDGDTWAETEHLRRRWSFSLGFSEALIKWNGSVPCALTVFFFSYSAFGKHTVNMYLSVLVVLICDKDGYKWNSLNIKCLHTTVSTPLLCPKRDDIFFSSSSFWGWHVSSSSCQAETMNYTRKLKL